MKFLEMVGVYEQDPKELLRNLQKEIRQGQRDLGIRDAWSQHFYIGLDREILHLKREEQKLRKDMKKYAKDGQVEALRISARSMLRIQKTNKSIQSTKNKVGTLWDCGATKHAAHLAQGSVWSMSSSNFSIKSV